MIRSGAVALLPTDSQYALACDFKNKKGIEQIRSIRDLDEDGHLSLLSDSLSGIARFALLSDHNFKLIKRLIPGPYTLIVPAAKEVPKLMVHPKKKTAGIRVPDYPICREIAEYVGNPLLAITAKTPQLSSDAIEELERETFLQKFEKKVDVIIDNQQPLPSDESTIIDLTGEDARVVREGIGADEAREIFTQQGIILEAE
jgi:tRNA threonylcarbamoyl adenosine modification protein (Sua5/YciO/YrdC/YwlC family)